MKYPKPNKNSVLSVALCENKIYEAFGNIVYSSGTLEDNREFTSKEKDPTGFHYFGARYYYGNIGRFLTPDPHTLSPGNIDLSNPQELNPYVYCMNDPLKYVDPDGRMIEEVASMPILMKIGSIIGSVGVVSTPIVWGGAIASAGIASYALTTVIMEASAMSAPASKGHYCPLIGGGDLNLKYVGWRYPAPNLYDWNGMIKWGRIPPAVRWLLGLTLTGVVVKETKDIYDERNEIKENLEYQPIDDNKEGVPITNQSVGAGASVGAGWADPGHNVWKDEKGHFHIK